MKFNYQARTKDGEVKAGDIEAVSKEAAVDILQKYDVYITYIEEDKKGSIFSREIRFNRKISLKDLVAFSRQLSAMLASKVPPAEALYALGQKNANAAFQEIIFKVASDIREGLSLSKSFARHPNAFSPFYVGMIKSGEVSGNVPEILKKITSHLEKDYYFSSKLSGAMIYPAMVMVVFLAVFVFMFLVVIPNLTKAFIDSGKELPLVTQIIINISNFSISYWWVMVALIAVFIAFMCYYPRTREGRHNIDTLMLKLPIFGNFQKNLYAARFAENLATLISAGTPITQALEVSADLIGNSVYRDIILETRTKVMKGESISSVLERFPEEISPLFVQMVVVGERTGNLGESLVQVFQFYQEEIDTFIGTISTVIEPLLIIFLAIMVGILFAALIIPVYSLGNSAG
ncbi:MAG: type II secretion system F family protein [Candidatus Paceibacterota bacterium]|jgi:type II secretory pathway component PulF